MSTQRIFLFDEIKPVERPMRNGQGLGVCRQLFLPESAAPGSPFVAAGINILPPGTTIGPHKHTDDAEVFVILEGRGSYIDDAGKKITLKAGDAAFCLSGESHGLINDSDAPLLIAAIIAKRA